MTKERKFRTSAADAGAALDVWLGARLTEPAAEARARVLAGSVYVDGKRERDPARLLAAAQSVAVRMVAAAEAAAGLIVVHADASVIIVDKPYGVPVQATRDAAGALDEQVAAQFPDARLLHRIDRDTSGLVLFARADAAARLQRALERGDIAREYLAVVHGVPTSSSFMCDAPIGQDTRDRRRQAANGAGALPARTIVDVVERTATRALVRARLATGRTHQIRVHLADAGHPVLGDPLYAPPAVQAASPRLALHAARIVWPRGGAAESPLPPELAALVV